MTTYGFWRLTDMGLRNGGVRSGTDNWKLNVQRGCVFAFGRHKWVSNSLVLCRLFRPLIWLIVNSSISRLEERVAYTEVSPRSSIWHCVTRPSSCSGFALWPTYLWDTVTYPSTNSGCSFTWICVSMNISVSTLCDTKAVYYRETYLNGKSVPEWW